jgi:hypothetical protein
MFRFSSLLFGVSVLQFILVLLSIKEGELTLYHHLFYFATICWTLITACMERQRENIGILWEQGFTQDSEENQI